ncbi:hypothetical protein [Streptomyces sp. TLI_053]|nr:hypothetical protein [Streptomyces sp. TLI_053]
MAAAAGYGIDLRRLLVADHPSDHAVEVITVPAACPAVPAGSR